MGQRSQIFVRFEKNPGEKEIVARYYKWNCGDQMISIVYHTIEWLKKHLDLNNCGSGQYLLWNQKEFIRILGTKYDLGDVVIITDILNKYGDYWKDDNDGKALIDIQCDGAIKYALLIRNNTLCNPSEYMLWNLWIESILPNKPIPRRMIDNIGNHIQELSESAMLMTEEAYDEIPNWSYTLEFEGYLCRYIDSEQHVTPYGTSEEWQQENYQNIKEFYYIDKLKPESIN